MPIVRAQVINFYMGMLQERELRLSPGLFA